MQNTSVPLRQNTEGLIGSRLWGFFFQCIYISFLYKGSYLREACLASWVSSIQPLSQRQLICMSFSFFLFCVFFTNKIVACFLMHVPWLRCYIFMIIVRANHSTLWLSSGKKLTDETSVLTLEREIELIWKRRFTLPTLLYIFLRYLSFFNLIFWPGEWMNRTVFMYIQH